MPLLITPRYLEKRADFYDQVSRMLAAGLPLDQLFDAIGSSPDKETREVIRVLRTHVASGFTLTEALLKTRGWAPDFDIALIEAGENSGRLDQSFRSLAQYYAQKAKLNKEVISQLMYPGFMVHIALLVFPPQLLGRVVSHGELAQFVTQKAIAFGILYIGTFFLIKSIQSRNRPRLKSLFERIGNAIPVFGSAQRAVAMSRLSTSLEALITSGQPIARAWELAANATGSLRIQRASVPVIAGAVMGTPPGELLKKDPTFPDLFANLYRTGEITGDLDGALKRLSAYYSEEGTRKLQALAAWTPRIIFMIILVAVAYFIINFWMDYFGNITRSMEGM